MTMVLLSLVQLGVTSSRQYQDSTIGKYTNDLNDPLAWRIEALLGSVNRQLCLDVINNTSSLLFRIGFIPSQYLL